MHQIPIEHSQTRDIASLRSSQTKLNSHNSRDAHGLSWISVVEASMVKRVEGVWETPPPEQRRCVCASLPVGNGGRPRQYGQGSQSVV